MTFKIRPAADDDRAEVLALLAATHHWGAGRPDEEYFRWKHEENPLGPSYAWVAEDADGIVGYRAFLRWQLEDRAGRVVQAVRAVDAATARRAQRRGVFLQISQYALDAMADDGVELVFTTPNTAAAAGWRRLGARAVGQTRVFVRPKGVRSARRMLRARHMGAERWPVSTSAGAPATTSLADLPLADLLAARDTPRRMRTRLTPAHLRWRYGFAPLGYRTLLADHGSHRALLVFRVRRRAEAIEVSICEQLVPRHGRKLRVELARSITGIAGADYVAAGGWLTPSVPVPGRHVYALPLTTDGARSQLSPHDLSLGDVELL